MRLGLVTCVASKSKPRDLGAGLTHEIAMKELAHVLVIPPRLFAPTSDARSGLGVTLQKVQGHLPKHRPVACRRLVSNATLVLIEGHI